MTSSTRMSPVCGWLAASAFTIVSLLNGFAYAQGTTAGPTETGGDGPLFEASQPDLSVFSGVERSESIGSSATQGFGIGTETTGGAAAGGRGGGGGGFGGGGLGGLFGALGGAFGGQGATSQKPVIRVRLRSAVEVLPRSPEAVRRSAINTLDSVPTGRRFRGVNVTMDGATAILTGTAASEKDRRMSELLMRLEPGVRRIDNQVVIDN